MAFLSQDNKQLEDQQQQGQAAATQIAPVAGTSGVISGSAPSTAGVGKGGTGGWTNIQSYLTANQNQKGSADYLTKEVGGAFEQEKKNLDQTSTQATEQAKQVADSNRIAPDKASQMISQASAMYQNSGKQNPAYQNTVSTLQNSLNAKYTGPSDYAYGFGGKAQGYGSGLSQNFGSVMDGIYQNAAQGKLSRGSLDLQRQLDQENQYVNQARQNLLSRWSGLEQDRANTVQNTDQAVKGYQKQFADDQAALRNTITTTKNDSSQALDRRVKELKAMQDALLASWGSPRTVTGTDTGYIAQDDAAFSVASPFTDTQTFKYEGPDVTRENARGGDVYRNQFNTISDVLADGGKIAPTDTWNLGDVRNQIYRDYDDAYSNPTLGFTDKYLGADLGGDVVKQTGSDWLASNPEWQKIYNAIGEYGGPLPSAELAGIVGGGIESIIRPRI